MCLALTGYDRYDTLASKILGSGNLKYINYACKPAIRYLLALFLCLSFLIPFEFTHPQPAEAGTMKWDTVSTPNSYLGRNDILNYHDLGATIGYGSEILDMAVGNDGMTVATVARTWDTGGFYINRFYYSTNNGISFSETRYAALIRHSSWVQGNLFQVAIAPDDARVIAVTSSMSLTTGPQSVWITSDAGQNWEVAFNGTGILAADETIRDLDISADYGVKRDIGFVTTSATGGRMFTRSSAGLTDWQQQLNADGDAAGFDTDIWYQAIKFSPGYNGDSSVAIVFSDTTATYFQVGFRDLNANSTLNYAYSYPGIEVKNPASAAGASPEALRLNNADLELPSDFSGQSSSLRRAYISLDAFGARSPGGIEDGIYRIDDTTTYVLMDTTATLQKAIYSIAYFGTYASGKLLAGERMGFPCTATVPTWFTDSPTTCPIPCWYPALKPTTGAANQGTCASGIEDGYGAAIVAWNADGSLGMVGTGSLPYAVYGPAPDDGAMIPLPAPPNMGEEWWWQLQGLASAVPNDESAFGISRNNGETWNQLSLIDTTIDWLNDVVSSPDCSTLYLASVNREPSFDNNTENMWQSCSAFDSVWRSTVNINVATPLPAVYPVGQYWERVFTHTTSLDCSENQTDLPILRLPTGCDDKPDGEIVGWAAQLSRAQAWSPDFGDFWAVVTPRYVIQDFTFESSTIIYDLSPDGLVQNCHTPGLRGQPICAASIRRLGMRIP